MQLDPAELQELARCYTAAWCSQDPAQVAAFYEPHGALQVNDAAPSVGRLAITEVARGFMTAFPDLRVVMDDLRDHAGIPVYRWTLTGTHAASGRPVRISGSEQWQIGEDGLIAQSRGQFDQADYDRQINGR
jgi:hypothetical protein